MTAMFKPQPPIFGNLMPAAFAACSTYLKVWKNAPPRSRAVDMSPILAKFAAMASGVHWSCGRLRPSVSTTLITANEPAPAPMIVRVGASSLSRYSTAGVMIQASSAEDFRPNQPSVMRVAVGEIVLTDVGLAAFLGEHIHRMTMPPSQPRSSLPKLPNKRTKMW